jgi:hypothetical protein
MDTQEDTTMSEIREVAAEPNIVAEHKGVKIAITPDYKFVAVASERFNGGKYNSLRSIKKGD